MSDEPLPWSLQPHSTLVVDPSTIPELEVVLRAGRLSRFRALDVACRRNARLAQVLRTGAGPILLARTPHWERAAGRGDWLAVRFNHEHPPGIEDGVTVQCGDGLHHEHLLLAGLREIVKNGNARRVVYPLT